MRVVERYLVLELLKAFVLMGAALIVLFDLFSFLAEAEDIGDGTYEAGDALLVTLYTSPARFTDLVPFVGLLGTVYALSLLTASHEVVALRAAAVSPQRIAALCIAVATASGLLLLGGDQPGRALFAQASLLRMYETSATGKLIEESGFWIQNADTFVNIENLAQAGRPMGIRIFNFAPDGTLSSYLRATDAIPHSSDRWTLENVVEKERLRAAQIETRQAATLDWTPIWDPSVPMVELPVTGLGLAQIIGLLASPAAVTVAPKENLEIELWKRVYLPMTAGAFALLGAASILRARPRHGVGAGLLVGLGLAFVVYIGGELLQNVGLLLGTPAWVTQLLPAVLVTALASMLLRAAR
jgi:lipopolysaccharide export system permease protein